MQEFKSIIETQIAWSSATFGTGKRRIEIAKHIQNEIVKLDALMTSEDDTMDAIIAKNVDIAILALDGLWREQAFTDSGVPPTSTAVVDVIMNALLAQERYTISEDVAVLADDEPDVDLEIEAYWRDVFASAMFDLVSAKDWSEVMSLIADKQAVNKARNWPAPGAETEPVEHIREVAA